MKDVRHLAGGEARLDDVVALGAAGPGFDVERDVRVLLGVGGGQRLGRRPRCRRCCRSSNVSSCAPAAPPVGPSASARAVVWVSLDMRVSPPLSSPGLLAARMAFSVKRVQIEGKLVRAGADDEPVLRHLGRRAVQREVA